MLWIPMIHVCVFCFFEIIQSLPLLQIPLALSKTPTVWDKTQPQLVYPQLYSADNLRIASTSSSTPSILVLRTKAEAFYIQLKSNDGLAKPTVFGSSRDNVTKSYHYHGNVLSHAKGVAAISLNASGNRMTGTIIVRDEAYILHPMDQMDGLEKFASLRNVSSLDGIDPHIIRKMEHLSEYCGFERDALGLYPDENEIAHPYRIRRSASEDRKVIKTAIYVDYPLYRKFIIERMHTERELTDIVLAIINQVQIIYNYQSLRIKFKIVVVKLVFIRDRKDAPDPVDGDIDRYLDNFCSWQSGRNPPESSEDHWDHAIMLSGYDLHKVTGGTKNKKVLGLAWVNGMCRPKHSCTLNEGSSFEAAFVIAHEMGHSLGMLHDGRGNNCNPAGYLMAEKTGPGRVTWSSCSNEYLTKFFQKGRGQCLEDDDLSLGEHLSFGGLLPGHRFDLDDQCKLSLGVTYRPHVMPKTPFNNVCRELWCVSGLWASIAHPALEGSSCGTQKECLQGKCKLKNSTSLKVRDTGAQESTGKSATVRNMVADFLDKLRLTLEIILP